MRQISFSILFLLAFKSIFLQANAQADSLDIYIKRLHWGSFQLTPTYFHQVVLNSEAKKIVDNFQDTATIVKKLVSEMNSEQKVVSIHIILSKVFDPAKNHFSESYIYAGDSIVATNYTFNTLKWQYRFDKNKFLIEPDAIRKIKSYWEKRLKVPGFYPDN